MAYEYVAKHRVRKLVIKSVACVLMLMNVNVQSQCSNTGLHVVRVTVARSVLMVFDKFTP